MKNLIIKEEKGKKIRGCLIITLLVISLIAFSFSLINFSSAQTTAIEVKYCCEKTTYGAWCQDAPQEQCDDAYRMTPASCEATSYCKLGCCYDSSEGICMENTPQKVCDQAEGTWSASKECEIAQCNLGCCVLGTQAAFVTLTRCKRLSALYGLKTDFRGNVDTELECIALTALQDEGACVYELDYVKTCRFTSRQECDTIKEGTQIGNATEITGGAVTGKVSFYKDLLCSAEELETNCGPTQQTTCVEGKDEVYFVDSCGNVANIYDASKIDKAYWRKKISKAESCGAGSANINSRSCGNCNYFDGSICKDYKKYGTKPVYGNNICADLNCKKTSLGKPVKHGESWCSTDDKQDSVGSRYFRHLCMNGEEIIEPCADFRQEQCIQDSIDTGKGKFSQAACRVNRWQDCYSQTEKIDCENKDKRDCVWTIGGAEVKYTTAEGGERKPAKISCVPEHAPGLKFWEEGESQGICSQANTQCEVTFEKKGLIRSGDEKCEENCECLKDSWKNTQLTKCESLGDCGAKVNYVGEEGFDEGYKITTKKVKEEEESSGLLGMHLILSKLGINVKAVQEQETEREASRKI